VAIKMTSFLKDMIEKNSILDNLDQYDDKSKIFILNTIQPNNFSDMIYISNYYLSDEKLKDAFLAKMKQITNWKVYFDQDPPEEFVAVFFNSADINDANDREMITYYTQSYKLDLDIFKRNFIKIYQVALSDSFDDRNKLKKDSTFYDGLLVAYSNLELVNVFDFLMDKIEQEQTIEMQLNNPYADVLLILLNFVKTSPNINLPMKRLGRLADIVSI
jgi:hypothetical protein